MPVLKKTVGRSKICSQARLAAIDPVWVFGRVPNRFWEDPAHRRDYLLWLGHKLGFRYMEDWYRLTHDQVKRNHGTGLATTYWHASAIEGVKQCFPEYAWHEWLFVMAPRDFWKDRQNHVRYMSWLGQQLGYRRPEDWYATTTEDFARHKGASLLVEYESSVSSAIMAVLPDHDWKEWMFNMTPKGFWPAAENRLRYLRWLGEELGYRRPEDWYDVRGGDFGLHFGRECLKHYRSSPPLAAMSLFPDYPWEEWKFQMVPSGFWHQAANRRRYMEWLGRELGFRCVEDWHRVRLADFHAHYGGGLLALFGSYLHLLRDCWPQVDWRAPGGGTPQAAFAGLRPLRTHGGARQTSALSIEQILRWADAFQRRTGRWPQAHSWEAVHGAPQETWMAIDGALRDGRRGLGGGSSLARLLARHRGVRNNLGQPPLSIEQILRWADQHRRQTGRWPTARSGPVAGTAHETWQKIGSALKYGNRGCSGGTTLARLLARHRDVRNNRGQPPLSIEQILRWADEHRRQTGRWPTKHSRSIAGSQETWLAVDAALRYGRRGLPGGSSLTQLLRDHDWK